MAAGSWARFAFNFSRYFYDCDSCAKLGLIRRQIIPVVFLSAFDELQALIIKQPRVALNGSNIKEGELPREWVG